MAPTVDVGDNFVGIGGPDERLWVLVGFGHVALDGDLEVDNGAEDTALQGAFGQGAKKLSTVFSQEQDVGVKWKVRRGCRLSQALTFGCLWTA